MSIKQPLGQAADGGTLELQPTLVGRRRRIRLSEQLLDRLASGSVALVLLLGLVLCLAATHTNILFPQSVRPAIGMIGLLKPLGFPLLTGELVTAVIAMLIAYIVAVSLIDRVSPRKVIIAVLILNVLVLVAPPMFSTDMFSYQAYERMFAIYHTNPYTHGPSVIQLDPIYNYIGSEWISTPSVYGPLFTLISAPLAWASIVVSELTFKLIAALCSAGTVYLIWKSARLRGVSPSRGIALYGLNPVVMVYGVGGGHNDFMMVWLMTLGIYLMLGERRCRSGIALMAGTAVKLTAVVVLPFALLAGPEPRSLRPLRSRDTLRSLRPLRPFALGGLAVAVVVAGASYAFFGTAVTSMFGTLQSVQSKGAWQSVPGFLFLLVHIGVRHWMRTALSILLAGSVCWLIRRVWKHQMDWLEGAAWATFAVLVTAWAMLPWYVVWLMPLVALCRSRALWHAAITMSAIGGAIMVVGCFPRGVFGI